MRKYIALTVTLILSITAISGGISLSTIDTTVTVADGNNHDPGGG